MNNLGEIAKLRRIISAYDMILSLCSADRMEDERNFFTQSIQELIQDTLKARTCASNILLVYGDDSAHKTQPVLSIRIDSATIDAEIAKTP